jgi:hypothetical protein
MRLIYADVAKKMILSHANEFSDVLNRREKALLIGGGTSCIDKCPTINAVEVVRCKDCIHYEMGVCLKIYSDGAVSEYAWQERNPDDFCSYGERREENAAD